MDYDPYIYSPRFALPRPAPPCFALVHSPAPFSLSSSPSRPLSPQFEFIIDGPPLAEMASAEAAAAPGELVVSHAVWNVYHETDSECIADVLPPNVAGGRENVCIRHIQTAEGSGRNSAMVRIRLRCDPPTTCFLL